jgi:hypothetical protein
VKRRKASATGCSRKSETRRQRPGGVHDNRETRIAAQDRERSRRWHFIAKGEQSFEQKAGKEEGGEERRQGFREIGGIKINQCFGQEEGNRGW